MFAVSFNHYNIISSKKTNTIITKLINLLNALLKVSKPNFMKMH